MKRIVLIVLAVSMSVCTLLAQTAEDIRREANPPQVNVVDNSPAAQLWREIVAAKMEGNEALHATLLQQFRQDPPARTSIVPPVADGPQAIGGAEPAPEIQPDWGSGDVLVHSGNILSSLTAGNGRSAQLEVDSLGNKYAAVIRSTQDTLYIYKSTNQGANWFLLNRITPGGTTRWLSFDFYITDSSNVFRLGIAATRTLGNFGGELWWMTMSNTGTGFRAQQIQARPAGRGLISPAIVSDGFTWSTSLTYWYVTYQNVDSATGVGNAAAAALTPDWGYSWELDTARASFNDYDLDIDYTHSADTILVLLTNDITPTNENLRIQRISLGNWGGSWTQFNVANTANPENSGCLVSNRSTNQVVVSYTVVVSSDANIACAYAPTPSGPWTLAANVSSMPNNEGRARVDCVERQGAYRLAFVSSGASYDTVLYTSTFDPALGWVGRQVVNVNRAASTSVYPDVAGFLISGTSFGGGVLFPGFGPTNVYYDASNLTPTDVTNEPGVPGEFSLAQNYPNPFNPATAIRFSIPVQSAVKLVIYDMLGREVTTLVNEEKAAGAYTVPFDASNLASGTYFYRLHAGTFVETKKMMLVK